MNKRGQVSEAGDVGESSQEIVDEGKKKIILYVLIGIVAVLVIVIAIVLIVMMTGEEKPVISENETAGIPTAPTGECITDNDCTFLYGAGYACDGSTCYVLSSNMTTGDCITDNDCTLLYGVGYVCIDSTCYGSSGGGGSAPSTNTTTTTTTTGGATGPGPGIFQYFENA
ncbi:MAG TPA: hypothetical protein VJH65_00510 [Candidatus Nanoarchaeia archaeon]|nr:hypothetical protein [Candidatus Nanoarchaeia archaeon]